MISFAFFIPAEMAEGVSLTDKLIPKLDSADW